MKILLIDEDKQSMRYYVKTLEEAKMDVHQVRDVDNALLLMKKELSTFNAVILDSAMPPGVAYADKATEDGTLTGKFLFQDIREVSPQIPIMILTNFSRLEWIQAAASSPNVQVFNKIDMLPTELVTTIKSMIQSASKF